MRILHHKIGPVLSLIAFAEYAHVRAMCIFFFSM